MNIKNKKGFTLLEAMLSTVVIASGTAGVINYVIEKQEEDNQLNTFLPVSSIIKAVDQRVKIDGYNINLWNNLPEENKTTKETLEFAERAFVSSKNTECGKSNGWVPVLEDSSTIKLISCQFSKQKLSHYDLTLNYTQNNENALYTVDLLLKLKPKYKLEEEYLLRHKKLLNKFKKSDFDLVEGNVKSGLYDYASPEEELSIIECTQKGNNCAIKVTWTSEGYSESLRLDGSNNMINDTVKFSENYFSENYKCLLWEYDGNNYKLSSDHYDCGVGIFKKNLKPIFATVDASVSETTVANPIILKEVCTNYVLDSNGFLSKDSTTACGLFTGDGGTKKVIQVIENLQINAGFKNVDQKMGLTVKTLVTENLKANKVNVLKELNLLSTSNANMNMVIVSKDAVTNVNNKITIDVLNQLTKTTIKGSATFAEATDGTEALYVDNKAVFKELNYENNIKGDLKVSEVKSGNLKIREKTNMDSNFYCLLSEKGDLVSYNNSVYQCRETHTSGIYKWATNRFGEIQAFDSNCPSGWTEVTDYQGRTLVGEGWLVDPVAGKIKYKVGEKGGKATVKLTENEMPRHSHNFRDAYMAEHWGDTGERNKRGENGGQDNDNNYYTMASRTAAQGGDQAHENMMPFYTVKYCRYSIGDKASNTGKEPPVNVDDYWYPYESEYGDWYSTGNRTSCGPDEYTIIQEEDLDTGAITDVEYWVRICNMEYERIITDKEINYLTGAIRTSGTRTQNMNKSTSEAWQRGTPLIYDWYDISEPRNCKHPATNTVSSGNDFILTLYCEVDRERTYQERLVMLDSSGNPLEYRNLGELQKEQNIFWDNYLFTVDSNDYYKICGNWNITPEQNAKEWIPDAGDYDRNVDVPQTRTVEQYRVCSNKVDLFDHTYVLSTFNEHRDIDQSRTIKGSKINLKTWLENDKNGVWSVSSDGSYAYQSKNGSPTIFTTPTKDYGLGKGSVFKGWISVETTEDDDWIGFVMGKRDSNNFYLWSWKQGNQSPAVKGHTFAKVTSGVTAIPWDAHNTKSGYNVLRTDLNEGWVDGKKYEFRIEYKPDNIRLFIEGKLLFDVDGNFPSGAVGFYNHSQSDVKYYKITEEPYYE
tara:strand:- start:59582 stop:62881 length:3300 start_codon:yes stop_codon:yes gene_type:complete